MKELAANLNLFYNNYLYVYIVLNSKNLFVSIITHLLHLYSRIMERFHGYILHYRCHIISSYTYIGNIYTVK